MMLSEMVAAGVCWPCEGNPSCGTGATGTASSSEEGEMMTLARSFLEGKLGEERPVSLLRDPSEPQARN